jgi:hypothetical protein
VIVGRQPRRGRNEAIAKPRAGTCCTINQAASATPRGRHQPSSISADKTLTLCQVATNIAVPKSLSSPRFRSRDPDSFFLPRYTKERVVMDDLLITVVSCTSLRFDCNP